MLMDISVRYLHNDIIKPYENGGLESVVDSVTQKVLISDTTLRFLYPHNFVQLIPNYVISMNEVF